MKTMIKPHKIIEGEERAFRLDYCHEDLGTFDLFRFKLPEFQREFVWDDIQQKEFIESVFLGYNLGTLVTAKGPNEYGHDGFLLDGRQRLTTISNFVQDKFSIFNGIYFSDLKNISYPKGWYEWQHPGEEKNQQKPQAHWRQSWISVKRIRTDDVGEMFEIYTRLNFSGTRHAPITGVAIQFNGRVYSMEKPFRHHDIIQHYWNELECRPGNIVQGFVTEDGAFFKSLSG